jgi:hypothetical protein
VGEGRTIPHHKKKKKKKKTAGLGLGRLRVFENRVLRRIFIPKREEVAGS